MEQKWTLLFLVHAEDAKTKRYSNSFIDELKKSPHKEHVRIFILRNTYYYTDVKNMNAVLSELVYDDVQKKKELDPVKEYGKINLGDPGVLADVFQFVTTRVVVETRFMLITWDHGYSFGIFNGTVDKKVFDFERNENKAHLTITNLEGGMKKINEDRTFDKSIESAIEEFKNNNSDNEEFVGYSNQLLRELAKADDTDMLTPEEIGKALKASFSRKIDILLMMNCWMQSVDTCYALEDTVQTLIAAESTMDFIGYDYIDFINELCINPAISNKDLSSKIIRRIKGKYKKMETEIAFNEIAVSAIDLSNVDQLKKVIDNFSASLGIAIRTDIKKVDSERKKSYEFTNEYLPKADIYFYYLVDILDIVTGYHSQQLILKKDFAALQAWLNRFLLESTIGGNFSKETTALSMYFPDNREYIQNSTYYYKFYDPKGPLRTRKRFALDSHWSNFLNDYNKRL